MFLSLGFWYSLLLVALAQSAQLLDERLRCEQLRGAVGDLLGHALFLHM